MFQREIWKWTWNFCRNKAILLSFSKLSLCSSSILVLTLDNSTCLCFICSASFRLSVKLFVANFIIKYSYYITCITIFVKFFLMSSNFSYFYLQAISPDASVHCSSPSSRAHTWIFQSPPSPQSVLLPSTKESKT